MECSTTGFPVLHHLLELAQTHTHWVGDAIQPSCSLSSLFPPAFYLSQHQGSFLMSWLFELLGGSMGASASASTLPMNIQGWFILGLSSLISLLSKGLKSLLQHHNLKASLLWCSAFFMVKLSYPCVTTRKTIALIIQIFVSKVMSLLFNTLSLLYFFFQGASIF